MSSQCIQPKSLRKTSTLWRRKHPSSSKTFCLIFFKNQTPNQEMLKTMKKVLAHGHIHKTKKENWKELLLLSYTQSLQLMMRTCLRFFLSIRNLSLIPVTSHAKIHNKGRHFGNDLELVRLDTGAQTTAIELNHAKAYWNFIGTELEHKKWQTTFRFEEFGFKFLKTTKITKPFTKCFIFSIDVDDSLENLLNLIDLDLLGKHRLYMSNVFNELCDSSFIESVTKMQRLGRIYLEWDKDTGNFY